MTETPRLVNTDAATYRYPPDQKGMELSVRGRTLSSAATKYTDFPAAFAGKAS